MAVFAFTDGSITIDSNDLSDHCKEITLEIDVDDLDSTAFSTGGYKSHLGGLKDGKLTLTFNQDVAASALDSVMFPLLGLVKTFVIKPTSSAVGTSNPSYSGSVLVSQWSPLAGKVGDLAEVSVTFPTTGTITRATS